MTTAIDITPRTVVELWAHMSWRFQTHVVDKQSAPEMRVVSRFLEAIGVQNRDSFLRRYATTIHRQVYVPFEIGVAHDGWDLWHQVLVCAHEHQHVVQYDREGFAFGLSYLASGTARAKWEAEAYRANLELHHWRTGELLDTKRMAESLRAYGCSEADVSAAHVELYTAANALWLGEPPATKAACEAIAWLEGNAATVAA